MLAALTQWRLVEMLFYGASSLALPEGAIFGQ